MPPSSSSARRDIAAAGRSETAQGITQDGSRKLRINDVNEEPLPGTAEQATAQLPMPVTRSSNTSPFWISEKNSTSHRTHLYRARDRMRDLVWRQSALHPPLNTKRTPNAPSALRQTHANRTFPTMSYVL